MALDNDVHMHWVSNRRARRVQICHVLHKSRSRRSVPFTTLDLTSSGNCRCAVSRMIAYDAAGLTSVLYSDVGKHSPPHEKGKTRLRKGEGVWLVRSWHLTPLVSRQDTACCHKSP